MVISYGYGGTKRRSHKCKKSAYSFGIRRYIRWRGTSRVANRRYGTRRFVGSRRRIYKFRMGRRYGCGGPGKRSWKRRYYGQGWQGQKWCNKSMNTFTAMPYRLHGPPHVHVINWNQRYDIGGAQRSLIPLKMGITPEFLIGKDGNLARMFLMYKYFKISKMRCYFYPQPFQPPERHLKDDTDDKNYLLSNLPFMYFYRIDHDNIDFNSATGQWSEKYLDHDEIIHRGKKLNYRNGRIKISSVSQLLDKGFGESFVGGVPDNRIDSRFVKTIPLPTALMRTDDVASMLNYKTLHHFGSFDWINPGQGVPACVPANKVAFNMRVFCELNFWPRDMNY